MNSLGHLMLGLVGMLTALFHPAPALHPGAVAHRAIANHQIARSMDWRRTPYSSGVIVAHNLRYGYLHTVVRGWPAPAVKRQLTCSPAPCVFPNQVASTGAQPVNETPIATNPANHKNILTGGNDYNCATLTGFFESTDGGTTWNRSCGTLAAGSPGGDGDPIVGFDLNGVAYRGGIDQNNAGGGEIVVDHSTDGGVTWSTPVIAVQPFFSGGLTDKEWLQVDTSATSPHKNALYVSVTQFDTGSNSQLTVSHSNDGGATWSAAVPVGTKALLPAVHQFSDLAIAKDGTVYLSFLACPGTGPTGNCGGTPSQIMVSKSTDGGNTWSAQAVAQNVMLAPDSCGAYYGCIPNTNERVADVPAIASDNSRTGGPLYMVDYTYGTYLKVQVAKSTNGGGTWSAPRRVTPRTDTHDQFFPWISVSPGGLVGVTWMDRRNDPSNFSYEEFGAQSEDHGRTYPNQQLAPTPSSPNNDGFGDGFMGDYSGNMWAGSSLYASWTDTSNGSTAQDVVGGLIGSP